MNSILDKGYNSCSSCGICAIVCPEQCIEIKHDSYGFYKPFVNTDTCISCGTCKEVCYKYLEPDERFTNYFENKKIFAAWSKDKDVVKTTSSGGVGHEILKNAINSNQQVSGVVFDDNMCKHIITDNIDDLQKIKSSKYLQSYTPEAFAELNHKKKTTVIGTPCQIYGLRQYLKLKNYEDNFTLIDFFCHGTPSKLLWNKYTDYIKEEYNLSDIKNVFFRSKENTTWKKYSVLIEDINDLKYNVASAFANDMFFKLFLSDTCLNKACYKCLLRLDYCDSDIRLADFWGDKYRDNKDGVSLVTINTAKGADVFAAVENKLIIEKCTFQDLQNSQPKRFGEINKKRKIVLDELTTNKNLIPIYNKHIKRTIYSKIKKRFIKTINKFFR